MNYSKANFQPSPGDCLSHGWKVLWKNFLPLFLIGLVYVAISLPVNIFASLINDFETPGILLYVIVVMGYSLFILGPVQYGINYAYLKAVRGEEVDIKDMFDFGDNYLNVVLAYLLSSFIIVVGVFMLIIPGIVFACKLAFVPYLVVERKMEAMEAIKTSWNMTEGYAMNIFVIGVLSIFIAIGGFIAFFIGIIIAIMWITLAFSAMYYAAETHNNNREEIMDKAETDE